MPCELDVHHPVKPECARGMSVETRTRRSRWGSVLVAVVLVGSAGGCGSHGGARAVAASGPNRADDPSPQLASEGSSSTTPAPRSRTALRNPSVLPALPARRPILDLGPVLVEAAGGEAPSTDFLLVQADRLGADGFVLETEGLGAVYGLDYSREAAWRRQHPSWSVAVDVTRFLLTRSLVSPANAQASIQRAYYRAFRYADGPVPAIDLAWAGVAEDLRPWFVGAADLQAQLGVAHGLLAHAILDAAGYIRLRSHLLALDARGI